MYGFRLFDRPSDYLARDRRNLQSALATIKMYVEEVPRYANKGNTNEMIETLETLIKVYQKEEKNARKHEVWLNKKDGDE